MPRKDPRLSSLFTGTTNGKLLDRSIRHAFFLEGMKTREMKRVLGFLNDEVLPDLIATIDKRLSKIEARGFDVGPATTKRLIAMRQEYEAQLAEGLRDLRRGFKGDLFEIAGSESLVAAQHLVDSLPIDLNIQTATANRLRSIVVSRPFNGRLLREHWRELELVTRRNVAAQIRIGLAQGESVPQMIRRLRGTKRLGFTDGVFQTTRQHAEMIVRTAASHVSAHAREEVWRENEDLIKGVILVATLDSRTTILCIRLDEETRKKPLPVGSGPRPPIHPNCRTTVSVVTKSFRELGIDLSEAPEGTRESMLGEVPESLTGEKWLRKMDSSPSTRKVVDEVLGKTRAGLWRDGTVSLNDLVKGNTELLTVSEVLKLEGVAASVAA